MKTYPLEVENIGEDVYKLMSKGHHDVHTFMQKVREDGYPWPLGMPVHIWFRAMPPRNEGFTCEYVEVKEGERGAFPVTYVSEAFGSDRYEALIAQPQAQPQAEA